MRIGDAIVSQAYFIHEVDSARAVVVAEAAVESDDNVSEKGKGTESHCPDSTNISWSLILV